MSSTDRLAALKAARYHGDRSRTFDQEPSSPDSRNGSHSKGRVRADESDAEAEDDDFIVDDLPSASASVRLPASPDAELDSRTGTSRPKHSGRPHYRGRSSGQDSIPTKSATSAPALNPYRRQTAADEDSFMSSLLSDLSATASTSTTQAPEPDSATTLRATRVKARPLPSAGAAAALRKRKQPSEEDALQAFAGHRSAHLYPPSSTSSLSASSDPPSSDPLGSSPLKRSRPLPTAGSRTADEGARIRRMFAHPSESDSVKGSEQGEDEHDQEDDDEEEHFVQPVAALQLSTSNVKRVNARPIKRPAEPVVKKDAVKLKEEEEESVTEKVQRERSVMTEQATSIKKESKSAAWKAIAESLAQGSGGSSQPTDADTKAFAAEEIPLGHSAAHEDDESLKIFWIDYVELKGDVILFGKVKDRSKGKWATASLLIKNIQRNIYLLPRVSENEAERITEKSLKQEWAQIASNNKIRDYEARMVERDYAFEEHGMLQGKHQYLKVTYPFAQNALPTDLHGETFSRAAGQNVTAFEQLVIKRKIKGPSWLHVSKAAVVPKPSQVTHVRHQFEFRVDDYKNVNVLHEKEGSIAASAPPLTIMSLSTRSAVPVDNSNEREVLCVSARVWQNINLDDPTPPERHPSVVRTVVRPLFKAFPPGFEQRISVEQSKIETAADEKRLLQQVISLFPKYDPDIIVGHNLIPESLDILLSRMDHHKTPAWSQTGRLKMDKRPKIKGDTRNIFRSRVQPFTSGRILCDLSGDDVKKNYLTQYTTWSLTEMCETSLSVNREDIDPDLISSYFDAMATPERSLTFVRHCEVDTFFMMAIASHTQLLPLTRQLTNLAGNAWIDTLNAGAIARNEYILLHEFHRQKYICPNPTKGKSKVSRDLDDDDEKGTYQGGLVFEPKRGLWDKLVLVMDFNSLYPSIIQEYNIDFTTVKRNTTKPVPKGEDGESETIEKEGAADQDDVTGENPTENSPAKAASTEKEEALPELPGSEVAQGVLPSLISTLVQRRKAVKRLMKDKNATPSQLMQWNLRQLALKLTANSMYGCLGRRGTRFASRSLAALTTYKGREILTQTKDLAESMQLEVVYGDTDSVFINSNVSTYKEAIGVANAFKKLVNERYRLLEIDLDGVFARLLLLQKKKYAALTLSEDGRQTTEIKGLDMKRREYSNLSKKASSYVLEQILSGSSSEDVVVNIHDHLTKLGNDIRDDRLPLEDFIIYKQLGKDPKLYPDAKSQPHVMVALRMKTTIAKSKDVIPYVFCMPDEQSKSGKAENAWHPDDVRREGSVLKVDYTYYLSHQVLPPIARLCENIEGTDRAHLAECLGLNPSNYSQHSNVSEGARDFATLDSQIEDKERFRDSTSLSLKCRECDKISLFGGLLDNSSSTLTRYGIICQACQALQPYGCVAAQLEIQIRDKIAQYYDNIHSCDDATCSYRTRHIGAYGNRCFAAGCRGALRPEYTDVQLYNQLLYFKAIFDIYRMTTTPVEDREELVESNQALLSRLADRVDRHLSKSARAIVALQEIFVF